MPNTFYNEFDQTTREPADPARRPANEYRTPFQIDRDRIIHTSAFRRLQSKTQVFLSGEYDFYRTRLTHSIEVAQIGRSICVRLRETDDRLGGECFIDPDLVEAACLAHDIGHPPFGHTGERTLHRLMKPWGGFEGNAQTLRMLTRTIFSAQQRGMNPTRGFMDAVLKYKSLYPDLDEPPNHFLYSDQGDDIDFVMGGRPFPVELTPGKARNGFHSIECQIMDWSDDTAYSLNDVADGINAGFITIAKVERWAEDRSLEGADATHIEELVETIRKDRIEGRINRKIGAFIAAADLKEDTNFFSDITQRYRHRLEIDPEISAERDLYKRLSLDLVFRSQQLQQLDKKADYILSRLFGAFAELYIIPDKPGPDHFKLLSGSDERLIFEEAEDEAARARLVCDAIARMTDGVAARTYKRLFDADFGSIVDLV